MQEALSWLSVGLGSTVRITTKKQIQVAITETPIHIISRLSFFSSPLKSPEHLGFSARNGRKIPDMVVLSWFGDIFSVFILIPPPLRVRYGEKLVKKCF